MYITLKSLTIYFFILVNIQRINAGGGEVWILNNTSNDLRLNVYPISMVFNYDKLNPSIGSNYNLVSTSRDVEIGIIFINGANKFNFYHTIHSNTEKEFDFDHVGGGPANCLAGIGFGKYKFDFYWTPNKVINVDPPDDYFILDIDWGYTYRPNCGNSQCADLFVELRSNDPRLWYLWKRCEPQYTFRQMPANRILLEREQCDGINYWPEDKGNFRYNEGSAYQNGALNLFNMIPQDPRIYCVPQYFPYFQGDGNNEFYDNRFGELTLKLTIEKNIITKTETWMWDPETPTPIVIKNGATLILSKGNPERTLTFKKYLGFDFGTNLAVESGGRFTLENSSNQNEKAHVIFESYCNSIMQTQSFFTMGNNSITELKGNSKMLWEWNSQITFGGNGRIEIKDNALLTNCRAHIYGPLNYTLSGNGRYEEPNECIQDSPPYSNITDTAGVISLSDNSTFVLGDNHTLVFDGPGSYLNLNSGTTLLIGNESSIIFRNGAYIIASGAAISNINSENIWSGLIFEDAGPSTIQNCTFTGASTYLDFENTTSGNAANNITITGNTFTNGNIKIENTSNSLISSNVFSSPGIIINLIDISNNIILQPDSWSLNITGNQFTGGLTQVKLTGLAGNVSPFYVNANTFNGGANMGLWGTNISGSFKNNNYTSADYYASYDVIGSDMDVYNNALYSNDNVNVHAVTSNVKLAPVLNENNELVWYGGLNELTSANSDNIYFSIGSDAIVNDGNNCFTVQDQNYNHINGSYSPCFNPLYNAVRNLWNTDPPLVNVLCDGFPSSVTYTPTAMSCLSSPPAELSLVGYNIADMGNGIIDTVIITTNYGSGLGGGNSGNVKEINSPPVISEDKILYSQALLKKRQKDYSGSISACKNIINNFDTSKYLINALDLLFINHQYLDTIPNNNQQFTSLKEYLTQKIQQYQNNVRFTDKAYSYYLKSITKLKQYSEAIAGYENIMNNHPDPVVRLAASWERAAIILLMGTGGKNENANNNADMSIEYKKFVQRLFNNNPAHNIAKSNYKTQKQSIEANDRTPYTREEKSQIDNLVVKFNPVDHKELAKRSEEDYLKMLKILSTHEKANKQNTVPKRYKLYQNYPNPFNPKTNITFDLPKDIDIRLTVYDVLGREIYSINEFRKSGQNTITFDGTNLASGVYYYSLEAGTFVETRKMVLIK